MYRYVFIVEHVYQRLDAGSATVFFWEQSGRSREQFFTQPSIASSAVLLTLGGFGANLGSVAEGLRCRK